MSLRHLLILASSRSYRSVSKQVLVPEGDIRYITMSPRRWVVNDIRAWTCSKKLTPLQ